jgi:hypothetical protein
MIQGIIIIIIILAGEEPVPFILIHVLCFVRCCLAWAQIYLSWIYSAMAFHSFRQIFSNDTQDKLFLHWCRLFMCRLAKTQNNRHRWIRYSNNILLFTVRKFSESNQDDIYKCMYTIYFYMWASWPAHSTLSIIVDRINVIEFYLNE